MNKLVEKVPIPLAGLMLALATLGNMLSPYGVGFKTTSGVLAAFLLFLLVAKLATSPGFLRESFSDPVIASVTPTFSMGVMILSTYIRSIHYSLALSIWLLGLIMHIVLMGYFTRRYLLNFNINKIYPSYYIVYVGIVAGSVTAPAYNMAGLGQVLFWFGLLANVVLLPIVIYRIFFIQKFPEPALPTLMICAAPWSLCLAGYLNTFPVKSTAMVVMLSSLSFSFIVFAFIYLPKTLKLPFYPSYSSFTFPFVISAVAMTGADSFMQSNGLPLLFFMYTSMFLSVWSVAMVLYVFARYVNYLVPARKAAVTEAPGGIRSGV